MDVSARGEGVDTAGADGLLILAGAGETSGDDRGQVKTKLVPWPGSEVTYTEPPCRVRMCFTDQRPMPLPWAPLVLAPNSNRTGRMAGSRPQPWSATVA